MFCIATPKFRFFNSTLHLVGSLWNELEGVPLCLYHLQYMDVVLPATFATSVGIDNLENLIHRWVSKGRIPIHPLWEPYPIPQIEQL